MAAGMDHFGSWCEKDAVARGTECGAEVDILSIEEKPFVKPSDSIATRPAHEHASAAYPIRVMNR